MTLSWVQIRTRAALFSEEWKDATYEKGEAQSYYNDFFEVFGKKRRSVARFEEHVQKLNNSSGFIDLFWPAVLLVEHKSAGGNLEKAAEQAGEYFDALPEDEKPRYQLVSDFQRLGLIDRETNEKIQFSLSEFPNYVQHFAFIVGKHAPSNVPKIPITVKAAYFISNIHAAFLRSEYPEKEMEKCLTRLVFCLYADSAGIFQPRGAFLDFVESRTQADGSDLGMWLSHLFQVLDTPEIKRDSNLDKDLAQFPYINGGLFSDRISIPTFTEKMRKDLLAACGFDWSGISPSIFGSLFQSVLSKEERREFGGHFTSEENILKVIDDLFLNGLKEELQSAINIRFKKQEALKKFHQKLGALRFFDPACGCGNFLAISYREIRKLELVVLRELAQVGELDLSSEHLSLVNVDQFFGIELREYTARIAEAALWMTDHHANNILSMAFGVEYYRVPLKTSAKIVIGDALALTWTDIVPAGENTYILGNPPYRGAKVQSAKERNQIRLIANLGGSGGTLDYVCGWVIKAAEFAQEGSNVALVTVNSITQGEQVGQLWPILFKKYLLEISFAHQSFHWETSSPGGAQVQVIIFGLKSVSKSEDLKRLFIYSPTTGQSPVLKNCAKISPYLVVGDHLSDSHTVIKEVPRAINGFKQLKTGTKPIDGGYYILSESEKENLLSQEPKAEKFIRPFIGGKEFLSGEKRSILVLESALPSELKALPKVASLIKSVRSYRRAEIPNKAGTKKLNQPNSLWEKPTTFHITAIPSSPFLVIPEVTSERRQYVPIAWLEPPCIPSNLVKYLSNATLIDFALLTSSMHMSWLKVVGGRLEGRYRYSINLVYNTFPLPEIGKLPSLEPFAKEVLDVRRSFSGQSLEALYDPDAMPLSLREAHTKLDRAVDRLYLGKVASNDDERFENLLKRYEEIGT